MNMFEWQDRLAAIPENEQHLISEIAERAIRRGLYAQDDKQGAEMDISTVHAICTPLRLQELLESHIFDFAHDIAGIRNCLNRQKYRLERGFLPRFAKPEDAS